MSTTRKSPHFQLVALNLIGLNFKCYTHIGGKNAKIKAVYKEL